MVQIIRQNRFSQAPPVGAVAARDAQRIKNDQALRSQELAKTIFGGTPLEDAAVGGAIQGTPLQGAAEGGTPLQGAVQPQNVAPQNPFESAAFAELSAINPQAAQQIRAGQQVQQAERELGLKERHQKAKNIAGTSQTVNDLIAEGGDVEGNIRSFLQMKMDTLPELGFGTEETQAAMEALDAGGVEAVQKLARETFDTVKPFLTKDSKVNDFAKGQSFRVRIADPNAPGGFRDVVKTIVANKSDGGVELVQNEIGGELISALSETGSQETDRNVGEKRRIAEAQQATTRATAHTTAGFSGAQRIPQLLEIQDVLNRISTGGINAITLETKKRLGIENMDEATLSTNLLRNVLAQLRPIFGSQFTATEGESLKKIEAGITKSTVGNRKLIKQTIEEIHRAGKRAVNILRKQGNEFEADQLQKMLDFQLEKPPSQLPKLEDLTPEKMDLLSTDEMKQILEASQGKEG